MTDEEALLELKRVGGLSEENMNRLINKPHLRRAPFKDQQPYVFGLNVYPFIQEWIRRWSKDSNQLEYELMVFASQHLDPTTTVITPEGYLFYKTFRDWIDLGSKEGRND